MTESSTEPTDSAASTSAQRDREAAVSLALYHLFKWSFVAPLLHLYCRGRIYGAEHVPTSGPLVVVSNHASNIDPMFVSCSVGRPVAFMAKAELFRIPVLKQAIALYGAYPVKRGTGDLSAVRSAIDALENGWAAGIFLEGTRRKDGRIPHPKLGAARIAAKLQVPLLPLSLWGTNKIFTTNGSFPPEPVTIRIGEPVAPPKTSDRAELRAVTDRCVAVIHEMHELGR
ncbi:1-acyl-sn-glycerol-3-phosphate acyltransferase [Rubidibacter lacunae KORDI 51-2]|uniref:1-acyl-sn-glycerol-3-phosphate acyltransferase n=1 Tax=Rubidibacter lacunae KORDI 51-2 TaxID=582515 RepID=U5D8T7_9CHRO|nr:lysophospholipid acyltransferase family protein [Rubidibacter lacunae]ERN41013.1 1-acyl-sn-glycerol-3-phosphate acyltransferase [Rubidibacter lacunae KORDI 51-2]